MISLSTPQGDEPSADDIAEVRDSIKSTIDGQLRSSKTCARELLIEAIGAERYERLIADVANNICQGLL